MTHNIENISNTEHRHGNLRLKEKYKDIEGKEI